MKSVFGRKVGMTQVFDDTGVLIPVSVIQCEPMTVVQKKTVESHGYNAIQVGFGEVKERRVNKPTKGHFDKAGVDYKRYLREIRVEDPEEYNIGDEIKADVFEAGQFVDVVGTSKGKGTLGVVARHGFGRGRETHGSKFHRMPGGLSASAYPGRVFKGKRMAGKTGHDRVTVQNLSVVRVIPDQNLILVKGAIPGPKKGLIQVKSAVKK
ncbi:MAG: 50S ribosomal protein L3 [Tissierellia bacterium]|nr:50S ribosomal protein L3 [Tissierellia bacterium]